MKVRILQAFDHHPVEDGPLERVHAGSRPDVDAETAAQWKAKGLAVDDDEPAPAVHHDDEHE
jgi:hypothetical protein